MLHRIRRSHRLRYGLVVMGVTAGLAYWYRAQLIGAASFWYLQRVAAAEDASGTTTERQQVVLRLHRVLLLAPPPAALVPELFDCVSLLSRHLASGAMSWDWSAYLYTSYLRDAVLQRPTGAPRRNAADIEAEIDRAVAFFSIRKRPGQAAFSLADLLGNTGYTVDEVDAAHREGRDLGWAGNAADAKP